VRLEVIEGGPSRLAERAAVWLADRIFAAVSERGAAHLAVSGGSTPIWKKSRGRTASAAPTHSTTNVRR